MLSENIYLIRCNFQNLLHDRQKSVTEWRAKPRFTWPVTHLPFLVILISILHIKKKHPRVKDVCELCLLNLINTCMKEVVIYFRN